LDAKALVGLEIAKKVTTNSIIGVGTGSTVDAAISAIAERIKNENLVIQVVPTSYQSAWACTEAGLTVLSPTYAHEISWGFDGADAVDKKGNAIKGKGAAMLEEKVLAHKCREYFLIVDDSKVADDICKKCAIPVEVLPSGYGLALSGLKKIGATEISLRDGKPGKHGPVLTERGNIILDAIFTSFSDGLEQRIKSITGVIDSGLFENCANKIFVASSTGSVSSWDC
jgi:ribose 5-phosphate isomerase A